MDCCLPVQEVNGITMGIGEARRSEEMRRRVQVHKERGFDILRNRLR